MIGLTAPPLPSTVIARATRLARATIGALHSAAWPLSTRAFASFDGATLRGLASASAPATRSAPQPEPVGATTTATATTPRYSVVTVATETDCVVSPQRLERAMPWIQVPFRIPSAASAAPTAPTAFRHTMDTFGSCSRDGVASEHRFEQAVLALNESSAEEAQGGAGTPTATTTTATRYTIHVDAASVAENRAHIDFWIVLERHRGALTDTFVCAVDVKSRKYDSRTQRHVHALAGRDTDSSSPSPPLSRTSDTSASPSPPSTATTITFDPEELVWLEACGEFGPGWLGLGLRLGPDRASPTSDAAPTLASSSSLSPSPKADHAAVIAVEDAQGNFALLDRVRLADYVRVRCETARAAGLTVTSPAECTEGRLYRRFGKRAELLTRLSLQDLVRHCGLGWILGKPSSRTSALFPSSSSSSLSSSSTSTSTSTHVPLEGPLLSSSSSSSSNDTTNHGAFAQTLPSPRRSLKRARPEDTDTDADHPTKHADTDTDPAEGAVVERL